MPQSPPTTHQYVCSKKSKEVAMVSEPHAIVNPGAAGCDTEEVALHYRVLQNRLQHKNLTSHAIAVYLFGNGPGMALDLQFMTHTGYLNSLCYMRNLCGNTYMAEPHLMLEMIASCSAHPRPASPVVVKSRNTASAHSAVLGSSRAHQSTGLTALLFPAIGSSRAHQFTGLTVLLFPAMHDGERQHR